MALIVDTVTAPAHWASYLINDDSSGLEPEDIAAADKWSERLAPAYVVDVVRDEEGNGDEGRFTWSYALYGGTAEGGTVVDYVTHQHD